MNQFMNPVFYKHYMDTYQQTLEELVQIPAPSGDEELRTAHCERWLREHHISNFRRDQSGNLIVWTGQSDASCIDLALIAHLDTVFGPDTDLRLKKEHDIWTCPGIGDNTANVVNLLYLIEYIFHYTSGQNHNYIFVFDSCEEGLGNLKGCRGLFAEYGHRIKKTAAVDLYLKDLFAQTIGSIRYEVTVKTKGGHSYLDFGNANAIQILSELISELYQYQIHPEENTTYNVGCINGGTSVNTIAQQASMLFEYRSLCSDSLKKCDDFFHETISGMRNDNAEIEVIQKGTRPCQEEADKTEMSRLINLRQQSLQAVDLPHCEPGSASTDCNIPMSLGIPSICFGTVCGGGAHTLTEWINIGSMPAGMASLIQFYLQFEQGKSGN